MNKQQLAELFVQAIIALAKRQLADANKEVEGTKNWPAGQTWFDLVGSSQHTFRRLAMEEAGIDANLWCELVGDTEINLEDVYQRLTVEGED